MSARAAVHAMFQLDEAATAELDKRLDALVVEALLKAGVQYVDCPVCGAAQPVGGECGMCAFTARMAAELAVRGMVAAPEVAATPDFFQRGHTYHRDEDGTRTDPFVWVFEVRSVETHPDGTRYAFGFLTSKGSDTAPVPHPEWEGSWPEGWASAGWTDVTEAGGSRG
jgi:hypothetical protein